MSYYLINTSLTPSTREEIGTNQTQFAAVLTTQEWEETKESFDMGIDMDMEMGEPRDTKAIVNMDSLTGTFLRPSLCADNSQSRSFSFALDEKGIVLVDDTGYVQELVEQIRRTKKWRLPGMERFIYDLLEASIEGDLAMLEGIEHRLNQIENGLTENTAETIPPELNEIRGDLLDLRLYYEQLIDLSQELEENENGFFREETLRYFHMFTERVTRLQIMVNGQREYVMQLRDLQHSNLEIRMNRIMTLLTIVTVIFLPLTLIAGWYGMNFRYMPELEWVLGYPGVFVVCVCIVIGCLYWFRKKKWL